MTVEERTEVAMKMMSVISDRDITPGDVQVICISIIVLAYRKARLPKFLTPRIATQVINLTMRGFFEVLPEEGGEE